MRRDPPNPPAGTSPATGEAPKRLRGAIPTQPQKMAAMPKYRIKGETPESFVMIPDQISFWLNNQYGICVTAEEAYAKACHSPEYFMTDDTVGKWARQNNVLNGAELLDVLQRMQHSGFSQDARHYNVGNPSTVEWTNGPTLRNAIAHGPVKIAVAADQFDRVVGNDNGWFGVGFRRDTNYDHCVSLSGYGTLGYLAAQLGVPVPNGVDPSKLGYLLFTWNTIGIIDHQSMVNVTCEAWLRTPTDVLVPPDPTPPPPPPPPTPPTPTGGNVVTIASALQPGVYTIGQGDAQLENLRKMYRPEMTPAQWMALIMALLQALGPLFMRGQEHEDTAYERAPSGGRD